MAIDWNTRKTSDLILILGSLNRFKDNAKTDREKRNTARNIKAISSVLKGREV